MVAELPDCVRQRRPNDHVSEAVVFGCVRRRVFDRVYRWEFLALKALWYEVYEDMERGTRHDVDEESVQLSVYDECSNQDDIVQAWTCAG